MAPSRTKQESSPAAGPSKKERPRNKPRNHPYNTSKLQRPAREDVLPGVQKLKSALRQAKRLLAKDNLAADVRVETERRLKALEADLASAEQSRKERQYATKYHKVKFFERQKVVRKINQTKRSIASSDTEEGKKLEATLAGLRVDLNYVLHFPKTKRYISLFPPEARQSRSTILPVDASSDDNEERSKVREMIRQQMECGEISTEPENELGMPRQKSKQLVSSKSGTDVVPLIKARARVDDVESDDFFGEDDDEDSQQSEAPDS